MNTKGVEDGITDQPENGIGKILGTWPGDETDAELLSALDEVRGKSPEELPLTWGMVDGKVILLCPHKRRANRGCTDCGPNAPISDEEAQRNNYWSWPRALPVPERTAEMEQLMGRLRKLAMKATPGPWNASAYSGNLGTLVSFGNCARGENIAAVVAQRNPEQGIANGKLIAAASPENILRLLDHIEGKAKAVSQEVKE